VRQRSGAPRTAADTTVSPPRAPNRPARSPLVHLIVGGPAVGPRPPDVLLRAGLLDHALVLGAPAGLGTCWWMLWGGGEGEVLRGAEGLGEVRVVQVGRCWSGFRG